MRKILLINSAVIMAVFAVSYLSCKKTVHPTHPTPDNNRLLSYTKFSTSTLPGLPVNESFTFFYDAQKRVSQILYTTNDTLKIVAGNSDLSITFTYSNDTIYKIITATRTLIIKERDTFIKNSYGQIIAAYTPNQVNTFEYFGALISGTTRSVSDSGTTISATSTYTSDNGDLLNHVYDQTLNVHFPDSGLSYNPGYNNDIHDTVLLPPLTVTWTDYSSVFQTTKTTVHSGINSHSDVLNGYTSGDVIIVQAVGKDSIVAYDTCVWPGGIWGRGSYYVYPDLPNRTGDYLQIESFTFYGTNIYQNAHLVKQIAEQSGPITNITYTIDADSKVTQTYVKKADPVGNTNTYVYKFQYATY